MLYPALESSPARSPEGHSGSQFLRFVSAAAPALAFAGFGGASNAFAGAMVVDTQLDIFAADLTQGGAVTGTLRADLAAWIPHPVPEPRTLLMQVCGAVHIAGLASNGARRVRMRLERVPDDGLFTHEG